MQLQTACAHAQAPLDFCCSLPQKPPPKSVAELETRSNPSLFFKQLLIQCFNLKRHHIHIPRYSMLESYTGLPRKITLRLARTDYRMLELQLCFHVLGLLIKRAYAEILFLKWVLYHLVRKYIYPAISAPPLFMFRQFF